MGNSTKHAAIRRWISPITATINIKGSISKVEACGDGIRAWISSDRKGKVAKWEIEFDNTQSAVIDQLKVEKGEVIDFVVDCGQSENFSCDGFLWAPEISILNKEKIWSASKHFSGDVDNNVYLNPWQRFAQALLISNEVMFLD